MGVTTAPAAGASDDAGTVSEGVKGGRVYGAYVLTVLFLVNVINFADRSILSVLADLIKKDLGVTDGQIGFLVGTSFVVLNSTAGLAMGGIVDVWLRNRLLALAVGFWSGLTAISGFTGSFAQLAAARVGVGLGEAVGGPASHSLLADTFPQRARARAFSVYYCAPWAGTALCLAASGWIVQNWADWCGPMDLCGVRAWQVPFFVFGAPGILLAIAAWFICDPSSGEAAQARRDARPVRQTMRELAVLIPPFPFFALWRLGGLRAVGTNLIILAIILAIAAGLLALTGDYPQWIAVSIAFYALGSWCQSLYYRDRSFFDLTIGSATFRAFMLGASLVGTCSGAIGFWAVPYAMRTLGMDHATAGAMLGLAMGVGSIAGTLLGGFAADRWRRKSVAGPIWVTLISMLGSTAAVIALLTLTDHLAYAIALACFMTATAAWAPSIATLVQDMVLPTMRGRAGSIYTVVLTLIGMSAGPYAVGRIADATGSLKIGMLAPFATLPLCLLLLGYAIRHLPAAYALRLAASR